MRVHTESKVRLAGPILQIMARVVQSDTMIHRTREVRNFILPYAAAFQARACGEVEVSGKVVVGNKMRMVATASGQQFVSKPRLLVHFQHVHADMRNTGCQGFAERKAPALFRLMRQASDQVEVDVSYPARSQPSDVRQGDGSRMKAAHGRTFFIHERLHTQAHAIHAAVNECFQNLVRDRARSAFDSDLSRGRDLETVADRTKQSFQLIRREHRWRASAEVDRIHLRLEIPAQSLRNSLPSHKFGAHLRHIMVEQRPRKYPGGEVAEGALRAAKRYRDVKSLRQEARGNQCPGTTVV